MQARVAARGGRRKSVIKTLFALICGAGLALSTAGAAQAAKGGRGAKGGGTKGQVLQPAKAHPSPMSPKVIGATTKRLSPKATSGAIVRDHRKKHCQINPFKGTCRPRPPGRG